jgi:hypothetical protein
MHKLRIVYEFDKLCKMMFKFLINMQEIMEIKIKTIFI